MKAELFYLALVTALTGLLWVPYVLDRFIRRGILDTVGYPENPAPHSRWAQRLMLAHTNAVENLAVFAPLVLSAHALGLTGPAIATAAATYFRARVVSFMPARTPWRSRGYARSRFWPGSSRKR